jgi:hypothetical protein
MCFKNYIRFGQRKNNQEEEKEMNQQSTLGEVITQLETISANHHDDLIQAKNISFENMDHAIINGESYTLDHHTKKCLAYRMNIPMRDLLQFPDDAPAQLNHWISTHKDKELFFRFSGENSVRAILSSKYEPLNNLDVVKRLKKEMKLKINTKVQWGIDETSFMALNIIDNSSGFSIGKDEHLSGVNVRNSELGVSAFNISALIYRLVCSNGMVTSTGAGTQRFPHVSGGLLENLSETIQQIVADSNSQSDKLALSMDSPVSNPESTFKEFHKQFRSSKKEKEAVLWGYEQEPGQKLFHVIQGFTSGAKAEGLSAESAHKLQVTGGRILSMVDQQTVH